RWNRWQRPRVEQRHGQSGTHAHRRQGARPWPRVRAGASLAYFAEDGVLRLFDAARGKLIRSFSDRRMAAHSLAWSPDSSLIGLSGQGANSIILWNARTGEISRSWQGFKEGAWGLAFSPDGRLLAS